MLFSFLYCSGELKVMMKSSRRKSKAPNSDVVETTVSPLQMVQDELRMRLSQNSVSPALHGYEEERRFMLFYIGSYTIK